MKNQQTDELKQAQADFRRLQKDQQLPPLMQLKLAFLQAVLTDSHNANDFGQKLDAPERQSIQLMNRNTQERLFIEIVKCLSGRDVITYCYGQRTYLRRKGKLFSWEKCYLTLTTNHLILQHKRKSNDFLYRLDLALMHLTKLYKKYKGKYIFAVEAEGVKHTLGFDEEITCKRIHSITQDLLDQKKKMLGIKYDNKQFIKQREADRLALPAHKIKQIMDCQEYERLTGLEEKLKGNEMLKDELYKIHKNLEEGRIMLAKSGFVRTQVITKGISAIQVASCYIQMAKWNPSVEYFQTIARPRTNCLVAKLKTQKYSIFSYQRQATVIINYFKPCECGQQKHSNKSYLLIEDLPQDEEEKGGAIRMNLKQIVEFSPNKEDPSLLLISSSTSAKFNGFSSEGDDVNMTLHLFDHIQKYYQFTLENYQQYDGFFSELPCPCGGKQLEFTQLSFPTEPNEMIDGQNPLKNSRVQGALYEVDEKKVIACLEDICNYLLNEQILSILKNKGHEKYYLKHKFTQKDQSIKVFKEPIKNFLGEGINWKLQKQELIYINEEVLAAQKDILKMVLKQISSNIMKGKSIMNMSLPVQIFDKKSFVDVVADSYGFLPAYADKITNSTDLVEQMKYMACALMFVNATNPTIQKPFNPILGQTFQGKLGDMHVYLQQISHHPPISALLIKTKTFQFSANVEVVIDMGFTLNSYLNHWFKAKVYSTDTEYLIKVPDLHMGGVIYGTRTYSQTGKGFILQVKSNLFCEVSFGKEKKKVYESKTKLHSSDLIGGIFKVKPSFAQIVKNQPKTKTFQGLKPEHVEETCCFLSGKWYGDLYFEGKCYKSKNEGPYPYKAERMKYLLPSDSIWRQDLIYKVWKDNQLSNRQKQRLQNIQRNDKKLREQFRKKS